ncbi:hypothetical protein V502_04599 [Pseudogymnoascus sp. VKM F-4520 (FW-2644)]|nr:hypothetical protein V502_04599 [Pseudogymnoascus sp. VKM F-4520 (FW-2644)]
MPPLVRFLGSDSEPPAPPKNNNSLPGDRPIEDVDMMIDKLKEERAKLETMIRDMPRQLYSDNLLALKCYGGNIYFGKRPEICSLRLNAYLAWVNSWLSTPLDEPYDVESVMSIGDMASHFQDENLLHLLNGDKLKRIITSFRHRVNAKEILLGGSIPPSCDETNILTHRYDPRTDCSCNGLYPVPRGATVEQVVQQSQCRAVRKMVEMASLVNEKESEWNSRHLFTADHLRDAVAEFVLCNADEQSRPETCLGPMHSLDDIQAPDHYCEAADEKSLFLLQEVGAAGVALLKLCSLAEVISDWHFDNLVALIIQFGVLGYYRDHSRSRPSGVYGSRITGLLSHRYIDLAIYAGVMTASIGIGEEITGEQYTLLAEACCHINDLIDFRSDTMRKVRENVILRGVRGNLCKYLDGKISSCLQLSAKAIKSSPVSALVVMGFANWALMASHHKVYELLHGVWEGRGGAACEYVSASDGSYQLLLDALAGYGTLNDNGPSVSKRRADMDLLYYRYRTSPESHTAWLADSTRSLLQPATLRKIIDVVHFEWLGVTGDVEYCP